MKLIMIKQITVVLIGLFSMNTCFAEDDEARALGLKFLNAVGGQEIWSQAKTLHNKAVNHHPAARLPYIQEQWYSLEKPSHHTQLNNFDMDRERSFTEDFGWSKTETSLKPFSEDRLKNEISSWYKTLYHKLKLIALNDQSLHLERHGMKLSFYKNKDYLGWVLLAENGDLLKAGTTQNEEQYTTFGEMVEFGEVRWPRSGENVDGWRFEVLNIELLNTPMPMDQSMPQE